MPSWKKLITSGSDASLNSLSITDTVDIGTTLLSTQINTDIDSGSAEVVAQISTGSYNAAFFDFVIKNGTNLRAGTVYAVHDGTNVEYTETSTNDLGDTTGVELSVDLSGEFIRLVALPDSDNWSIKSLVRGL